ncbi:manganese efflux pump MntP family protein [Granulosicoccaceae sp. 1_MG-2023]|nr:manganese efflux pump MntP family protein [Granulosicoccaceae sp. 1_MG-2023]
MTELLVLAIALSMDAFAVAIGLGSRHQEHTGRLALSTGLYFGLFQGAMPVVGYLAGLGLAGLITAIDHWVAFALLSIIGGKMLYESLGEPIEEDICHLSHRVLLTLAIATSIDAMAAGFTLTLMSTGLWLSVISIGLVTFLFSYAGVFIGARSGIWLEKKAEVLGGVVLILIGVKILIEHTLLS